jgi:hypothetical protein
MQMAFSSGTSSPAIRHQQELLGEIMKIRDANGRFVPGISGNPQGSPGLDPEVEDIPSAAAPDAARKLVELLHSDGERLATLASQAILDRLYGKPATATDLRAPTARRQADKVIQLRGEGIVPEKIGQRLGISRASVFPILKDARDKAAAD